MSTPAPQPDPPPPPAAVPRAKLVVAAAVLALLAGGFWYWRTTTDYDRQGWDAMRAADYDRAVERYTKLIDRDPTKPDGYYLRGQAYAFRRDFAPALVDAEWLIERKHANGRSLRGVVRLVQHRFRDALKDFDAVVADGPPWAGDHFNRADALLGLYDLDAADDAVRAALVLDDKSADARLMYGRIATARYDLAGAVRYFTDAIARDPTGSIYHAYRASVYVELKAEAAAAADLDAVARLSPRDDYPDRVRSLIHLNRGEHDLALAAVNRALELAPWNPDGYLDRARLRYYRKEYRQSVEDYDECLRRTPDDAYAHANRVAPLIQLKDYDRAFQSAETARNLLPTAPFGETALAWLLATCPHASRRDPARAVFHAQQACRKTFEREHYALRSLAAAHAALGEFAESLRWQQKAMAAPGWRPREEEQFNAELLKLYEDRTPYRSP